MSKVIYEGAQNLASFLKAQKTVDQDDILKFDPYYIQTHRKTNMLAHPRKLIQYHKYF